MWGSPRGGSSPLFGIQEFQWVIESRHYSNPAFNFSTTATQITALRGHSVFGVSACQSFLSPCFSPHPNLPLPGGKGRRPREARGKSRTRWPCCPPVSVAFHSRCSF